ncbi:MAG: dehydrogenase subunit [Dehalococcoidia bacterium]|nr:dehydrogenase subunit [Dehalococcoidia bacterium]
MEQQAWLIFFLPFFSFLLVAFVTYRNPRLSGYITVAAIGGAFMLSVSVFLGVAAAPDHTIHAADYPLFTIGDLKVHVGLGIDSLTALMLIVVTSVSALVQIYSLGYMAGDPGFFHRIHVGAGAG